MSPERISETLLPHVRVQWLNGTYACRCDLLMPTPEDHADHLARDVVLPLIEQAAQDARGWSPSEAAIEAAAEALYEIVTRHGDPLTVPWEELRGPFRSDMLSDARAALVAAYAVDMPAEGERIATAIEAASPQVSDGYDDRRPRTAAYYDAARIARTPPEETTS